MPVFLGLAAASIRWLIGKAGIEFCSAATIKTSGSFFVLFEAKHFSLLDCHSGLAGH